MATSKKAVVPVEETVDTTPEVMDFVEGTSTEEAQLDIVIENTSATTTITDGNTSVTTSSLLDETGALTTRGWY
jgi:hypothetical protein